MAYVPVPKDLTAVKTKVLFNLTKRQLVCFSGGALVGVPLFFLLKGPANLNAGAASFCMVLVMLPFFLMAVYEKNGLPLEKIVRNIVRVLFLRSKQRPYQTNNFYAVLARQSKLDKEVRRTVGKKAKTGRRAVTIQRRKASDRSRRRKSPADR